MWQLVRERMDKRLKSLENVTDVNKMLPGGNDQGFVSDMIRLQRKKGLKVGEFKRVLTRR